MNITPSIEHLLENTLDKIERPPISNDPCSDEGQLDNEARLEIFGAIETELENDAQFRLFKARLACLCATAVQGHLDEEIEAQKKSLQLLVSFVDRVKAEQLDEIQQLAETSHTIFEAADVVDREKYSWLTAKNHAGDSAPYAMATIAQAIRLMTGDIAPNNIHEYERKLDPDQWMPGLFAAMATAGGQPQWAESHGYKMAHFWHWYLTKAIPLALQPNHPCDVPEFTPPGDTPPASRTRFTSQAAEVAPRDPNTTRRPFLHGYIDTTADKKGRTTFMRFVYEGSVQGRLHVNYKSKTGTYTDDQYTGVNYRCGNVEEVHLSHLAGSEEKVPIERWVQDMEAMLLQDILSTRISWFLGWAEVYWNPPDGLKDHQDDLRIVMNSIEWVFRAAGVAVEDGRPYHQISWCLCAFALGEQLDRARSMFPAAWEADKELFEYKRSIVDTIVGDHVPGMRIVPKQKRRWWKPTKR